MSKDRKTIIIQQSQTITRMMRAILAERLLEYGLYPGQDLLLLKLAEEDGITVSLLAKRLGLRPPTVTKSIKRLETEGFVIRQASLNDQRQTHIHMTEQGHAVIRSVEKSLRKTEKDCVRGLDKKERKVLTKLLGRVEMNLLIKTGQVADDADINDEEALSGDMLNSGDGHDFTIGDEFADED